VSHIPINVWVLAARPKTLSAAFAPVIIGTSIAYADQLAIHWPSFAAALLGALLIQIGTNFANDYFDFQKGADTGHRVGPTRATQAGLVTPGTMRRAYKIAFSLALIPGTYVVWRGGWPFVVIGLASIAAGILYTGGPFPLGYLGLGDLFVLIFFGPVAVCGTYYLHALEWTPVVIGNSPVDVIIAGLAPGLVSVAILTVNNLRDIEQDRAAKKRTLVVRFGPSFAKIEYIAAIAVAGVVIPLYFFVSTRQTVFLATPAVIALSAVRPVRTILFEQGPALNQVLSATGKILLAFSIVFSLGWIYAT
jgi:1,4-dihydroxy-2-naphthoate octaprenyltransferase